MFGAALRSSHLARRLTVEINNRINQTAFGAEPGAQTNGHIGFPPPVEPPCPSLSAERYKEEDVKSKIEQLVSILEDLLNDELRASVAQKKIEALSIGDLGNVYANLFHYLDDEDIREKDSRYKHLQNSELKKLIYWLKVGDLAKASKISFLTETSDL